MNACDPKCGCRDNNNGVPDKDRPDHRDRKREPHKVYPTEESCSKLMLLAVEQGEGREKKYEEGDHLCISAMAGFYNIGSISEYASQHKQDRQSLQHVIWFLRSANLMPGPC